MEPDATIPDLIGKRWHVAVVKPQMQYRDIARKALQARGYSVLLPMCREMVIKDGKPVATEHPLYGRYLFVGVGSGQDSWDIRWVPGIQHMTLDAKRRPIVIGIPVLEVITARMRADGGLVDLMPKPKAVNAGSGFIPGQHVRFVDGLFTGWEGLFQGDQGERCRVLLTRHGRETMFQVPAKELTAA